MAHRRPDAWRMIRSKQIPKEYERKYRELK